MNPICPDCKATSADGKQMWHYPDCVRVPVIIFDIIKEHSKRKIQN